MFEAFKRGDIDQLAMNLAEHWYEKLPNDDADVANGYIHKKLFFNRVASTLGFGSTLPNHRLTIKTFV